MPFVFDFTLKGSDSNSFVPLESYQLNDRTIEGADDYFDGHPKQSSWTQLTDTEKQQFLVRATNRLNAEKFGGRRATEGQRLQWPRSWITSREFEHSLDRLEFVNGFYYQSADYLPREIEQATFELALWYVEQWKEQTGYVSRSDRESLSELSIGPLSMKIRKAKEHELPDIVKRLLRAAGPNAWLGGTPTKFVR